MGDGASPENSPMSRLADANPLARCRSALEGVRLVTASRSASVSREVGEIPGLGTEESTDTWGSHAR